MTATLFNNTSFLNTWNTKLFFYFGICRIRLLLRTLEIQIFGVLRNWSNYWKKYKWNLLLKIRITWIIYQIIIISWSFQKMFFSELIEMVLYFLRTIRCIAKSQYIWMKNFDKQINADRNCLQFWQNI